MKTLNLYVTKSFLVTFVMAIGILTFGMLGARLIKIFDYLAQGVPITSALSFLFYISPLVLTLSIPWAAMVSIMLIFGRLSADSEITAMRACGVSILQIISPIIIVVFLLTCVCLYLQLDLAPTCTYKARSFLSQVAVDQPLSIFEPGRPVEFEGNHIYIDNKVGTNGLKDIQIFRMSKDNNKVEEDITATSGKIEADKENQLLNIVLFDANIVSYPRTDDGKPSRTFSKEVVFSIDYGRQFNKLRIGKEAKYHSFKELFGTAKLYKRRGMDTTRIEVELNQRIALALSPIAFMLLGMPLAIRTSRRETSIGLFLSVILAGVYFSLVISCDAFSNYPKCHPQVLLWIPCIIYQIGGLYFLFKIARR